MIWYNDFGSANVICHFCRKQKCQKHVDSVGPCLPSRIHILIKLKVEFLTWTEINFVLLVGCQLVWYLARNPYTKLCVRHEVNNNALS